MAVADDYRQLSAIQATADLALNGGELQTIAQGILECAVAYARFDLGVVRFFDVATQTLEPVAHVGFADLGNVRLSRRKLLDTGTGRTVIRVIEAHETQVIRDLLQSDRMRTLRREHVRTVVVIPIRAEGQTLGVLTFGMRTLRDPSREELLALETMADHLGIVLQKTRLQERLTRQALYDELTGLPNRSLLCDRLDRGLEAARRDGTTVTVLFMDLDRFKDVNDRLGHAAGDQVLVTVAQRLAECIRPGDTVARLGGDEFIILLASPSDLPSAKTVARRVLRSLRRPLTVDGGHIIVPAASVGIAVSGADDTAGSLLQNSDVAMYDAKKTGGARVAAFRTGMRTGNLERIQFEERLSAAVRHNGFHLHYQPIVDVQTHAVTGVEALLRWDDPVEGSVSPQRFIPVLEQNQSIRRVGRWVLHRACRDAMTWQHPGSPISVSVNVSPEQLKHRDFVSTVRSALDESHLPAELLVLEVTESMLVCDTPMVVERLEELRDLGVRIAVDDFGVGYSSLSYLRTLPLDILKIDKTFIDGAPDDPAAAALLRAVVDLGAALGLQVTVEGVEDARQAQWLQTIRCHLAQGFHYARPMPADALFLGAPRSTQPDEAAVALGLPSERPLGFVSSSA